MINITEETENEVKNTAKDKSQDVKIADLQTSVDTINSTIATIQTQVAAINSDIDDKYAAQTQTLTAKIASEIETLKAALAESLTTATVQADDGNFANLSVTTKATVTDAEITNQTVTKQNVIEEEVTKATIADLTASVAKLIEATITTLNISALNADSVEVTSGTISTITSTLANLAEIVTDEIKAEKVKTDVLSGKTFTTPTGTPDNTQLLKVELPAYDGIIHFITEGHEIALTLFNNTLLSINQTATYLFNVTFTDEKTTLYFASTGDVMPFAVLLEGSEQTITPVTEIVSRSDVKNNINFQKGVLTSENIHSAGANQLEISVLTALPETGVTDVIYIIKNDRSYIWDEDNSVYVAMGGDVNAEASARSAKDTELETKITANTGDIATNTANIAANTTSINTINSTISSTKIRLTTDEENIATNTTNIGTNTSDISAIDAKIPSDASSTNKLATASDVTAERTYADSTFQKKLTPGSNISISDDNEIACDISTMNFKGSVTSFDDLPSSADVGDVYNVTSTSQNYCWDGSAWITIGSSVDISGIAEVIPSAASKTNQLVDNAALNDTLTNYAKTDLSNASVPYVTALGSNYRLWSNGFKEVWGNLTLATYSYTFPITFTSQPYVILQGYTNGDDGATNGGAHLINAKPSTTGFTVYRAFHSQYFYGGCYYAMGY